MLDLAKNYRGCNSTTGTAKLQRALLRLQQRTCVFRFFHAMTFGAPCLFSTRARRANSACVGQACMTGNDGGGSGLCERDVRVSLAQKADSQQRRAKDAAKRAGDIDISAQ